jgi:hypothetical protein
MFVLVRIESSGDELFLALVSMIQVTRPSLLTPAGDGFDVDVAPLLSQEDLNADEQLVLRLYGVLSQSGGKPELSLELTDAEAARLRRALALVETSRAWPADALALCRTLRVKLEQ